MIAAGSSGTLEDPVLTKRESMEFTSRTREFVQSQYEALLPALGESSGQEETMDKADPSEGQGINQHENSEFPVVPFVESPSF